MFTEGVSFLVGATLGASYRRSVDGAERGAERLRRTWAETNRRLARVDDLVRYRGALQKLREKQAGLGRPMGAPHPCKPLYGNVQGRQRRA